MARREKMASNSRVNIQNMNPIFITYVHTLPDCYVPNSYNQQTISGRNSCTCTLFVKKYSNLLLLCFILKQLYQYVSAVLKKNYKACVLTKLYHGAFHFESNSGFPDKSRDKSVPKNTFSWRLVLMENCTVHW